MKLAFTIAVVGLVLNTLTDRTPDLIIRTALDLCGIACQWIAAVLFFVEVRDHELEQLNEKFRLEKEAIRQQYNKTS